MLNTCRVDVKFPPFTSCHNLLVLHHILSHLLTHCLWCLHWDSHSFPPNNITSSSSTHTYCHIVQFYQGPCTKWRAATLSILGYRPCCLLMAPMGRGCLPLLLLPVLPLLWLTSSSCIQHLPPPHLHIAADGIFVCGLDTIFIYTCVVPEHLWK